MVGTELVVNLLGREVGKLVVTRRGARFSYHDEIVQTMSGRPLLSLSLPVKSRAYNEGLTGSWFRGLLPEGERLTSVCRAIGCVESDYVAILEKIGWECAGAVSIHAPYDDPPTPTPPQPLGNADLAEKLRELPSYGGVDPLARVSLGGYQEKLLVAASDVSVRDGYVAHAEWGQPDAATISTHILKPQPEGRYGGIVEAEAWAMCAAQHAARCAKVALLHLDDAPLTLVVERFDRMLTSEGWQRLHQEDCCQAMGIEPGGKYAGTDAVRGSDPSYVKIARLIDLYSADSDSEKRELLRQLVVNLVMGNVDAHAKNYALLYRTLASPTMSPLYDVVPVVDIEPRAVHLSMRIDGILEFSLVERRHVLAEAMSWGLPAAVARETMDETLDGLAKGVSVASELYPHAASGHGENALGRLGRLSR